MDGYYEDGWRSARFTRTKNDKNKYKEMEEAGDFKTRIIANIAIIFLMIIHKYLF